MSPPGAKDGRADLFKQHNGLPMMFTIPDCTEKGQLRAKIEVSCDKLVFVFNYLLQLCYFCRMNISYL